MKTSLQHLPEEKQQQILQIVEIIKEVAVPEKVILFGSYAKGKQIEHKYKGKDGILYEYISDYDFLVVMKENTIKEYILEDIINNRLNQFAPSVNIQIHEISYINQGLELGQYFFTDIIEEGVLLWDNASFEFPKARELTVKEASEIAKKYYEIWFLRSKGLLRSSEFNISQNEFSIAAFELHQTAESLYYCVLLVFTGYKPKTHNLWKLRKQAKILSEDLFLLFPVETDQGEFELFELLKRAYIDARYKSDYEIKKDQLDWMIVKLRKMQKIVEMVCSAKMNSN